MASHLEEIVDQLKQAVAEVKSSGGPKRSMSDVKTAELPVSPSVSSPLQTDSDSKYVQATGIELSPTNHSEKLDPTQPDPKSVGDGRQGNRDRTRDSQGKMVEKRAIKGVDDFTFKPARNRKSAEILADKAPKFAPLHEPKVIKEAPVVAEVVCVSAPVINARSQAIASQKERSGPIHDRLIQGDCLRQKKLDEKTEEIRRKEFEGFTGVPQIDKNSEVILKKKAAAAGGEIPDNTVARLADYEIRKREERRKMLEEQYLAQLRKATETISYISPVSKRIVERSELESKVQSVRMNQEASKNSPEVNGASEIQLSNEVDDEKDNPNIQPTLLQAAANSDLPTLSLPAKCSSKPRSAASGAAVDRSMSQSPRKTLVGTKISSARQSAVDKQSRDTKESRVAAKDLSSAGSSKQSKSVLKPSKNVHFNEAIQANNSSLDEIETLRKHFQQVMDEKEAQSKRELAAAAAQSEIENSKCASLRIENERILMENIRLREQCEKMLAETDALKTSNDRVNVELESHMRTHERLSLDIEAIMDKSQAVTRLNETLLFQDASVQMQEQSAQDSQGS